MATRFFFPQAALDQWTVDEKIDVREGELTLTAEMRKYRVTEAVHIIAEVSGAEDAHGLVGKVKGRDALTADGAEVIETSMIFGDNAYDVMPGFLGEPVGDFREFLESPAWEEVRFVNEDFRAHNPLSDEDLLQAFMRRTES